MNTLTIEQINQDIERLEKLTSFKSFTLEEAKAFIQKGGYQKELDKWGVTLTDEQIIAYADQEHSMWFEDDKRFIIKVYKILLAEEEAKLKSKIAEERLRLYGISLPEKIDYDQNCGIV